MLNTAQMRDAIHVQKFRQNSGTLDIDTIIKESAACELITQQALQKALGASMVPKMPARSWNVGHPQRIEALRDAPPSPGEHLTHAFCNVPQTTKV
jgi:hypothetical protein